ncbi:MAG: hypothetical protein PVH00_13610 [Gemmatimonadota bacterium]|jgi:hypothetical protein
MSTSATSVVVKTVAIFSFVSVAAAGPLAAQAPQRGAGRNELTLTAEPVAGGVRYLRGDAAGFRFGAGLTIGPLHGVTIADADTGELDEWATLHALVGFGWMGGFRLTTGPGASLAIGDDFSALYPSGQLSFEWATGRFRLGTVVKAMRIAGSYGTGDYWLRWIPVRIGVAFD